MRQQPYNLINEPWIPVASRTGTHAKASLRQIFQNAGAISRIDSGDPLERFSIMRLLTAIQLGTQNEYGDFSADHVLSYLNDREELFDLRSATKPFLQVAGMEPTGKDAGRRLGPLHPSTGKAGMWSADTPLKPIPPDEAARRLLVCRNYDIAGIHTGMKNDPHARNGKATAKGVAQAGGLFLSMLEGVSLADTLVINLPERLPGDRPIWDVGPETVGEMPVEKTGPAAAYTWHSRCVRLLWDGNGDCWNVYCTYGNRGYWDDRLAEPSAFRKPDGKPAHMVNGSIGNYPMYRVPFWYSWTKLMGGDALPPLFGMVRHGEGRVTFETCDVSYGNMSACVDHVRNDRYLLDVSLLDRTELVQQWIDETVERHPQVKRPAEAGDGWKRVEAWRRADDEMRVLLERGESGRGE